jgi:hypothetical protein
VKSKNVIGPRVGDARRKFDPPLTQDALSGKLAAIGVQLDRAAIAKIENGHRRVFDYEVRGLAKALNVKVDWLFGGSS